MKFCIDKLFLLSLIFGRVQVDGKYIIASEDDVIKNSFIVVFYPDEARRSLRSIDPLTTFDSDANFSAQQVTNLASSIYDDVGGGFKVSNIYTKAILGFAASGDEKVMQKVAQNPNVMNVEENRVVRVSQQTPATWGIDRVDQRDRPLDNTYSPPRDGTGVAAYIIDTGVQISHDEFGDRARWGTNTSGDSDDSDCHGHGTHVAGTVGGSIYGVAKNVEIIAVKVLTCAGSGSNIGVIDGVEWVLNDAGLKGKPATANMSLGGGFSASLNAAVKALNNGGVPTVVAAGNDNGNACTYSPASEPDVITVGSTTSNDSRSGFSNFGSCVDIFAPGSGITAAWIGSNSATNTISGTSMASPHVCGGVALLLQEGIEPGDIAGEIVSRATKNKVTDPKAESPNELLFVGPIGPTNAPTPAPPTPAPTPCISKTVIVEVTTDNYPQETSWELTNLCSGDVQAESDPFPSPGETYTSEECIPSAEYTFKITDSYGDGLCCSYGQGSYTVTYDDVIEKEGAQFGSSESTTFGSCPSSPTSSAPVEPTSAPVEPTSAPVAPTSTQNYVLSEEDTKCPHQSNKRLFKTPNENPLTVEQCYQLCYDTEDCKQFSWGTNSLEQRHQGVCMGCTSDAVLSSHTGFNGFEILILRENFPTPSPTAGSDLYDPVASNKKCPYNNKRLFRTPNNQPLTKNQCYEKCKNTDRCEYFTYGEGDNLNEKLKGLCIGCEAGSLKTHSGFNTYVINLS